VGPRLSFCTAWSANAGNIFRACGLEKVTRAEVSRRFSLSLAAGAAPLTDSQRSAFAALVHDRMTECVYDSPLRSFAVDKAPQRVFTIPVLEQGASALRAVNSAMGLAFDDWDVQYYDRLFSQMGRDPTNVELFDIAQSNSEHSRHWFFGGQLVVDGVESEETLFEMVKDTLKASPGNSVIGFSDNSSAIVGARINTLRPASPGLPSELRHVSRQMDILFTAETHNFPCAVAPFPGAETGVGGRIRDTHATGRGSLVVASTAGYCVGALGALPGSSTAPPHEDRSLAYPSNLAPPLQVLIDASNGASEYGNKFGEPLLQGFCRSFGLRLPSGERREWLKPIMFSGGLGQIDHEHLCKREAEPGLLVVKLGGPAYRIGLGGGAASSMTGGCNDAELDFNAVQRGDAEMAAKLNRVVRACVELGEDNPILSIHDQGAGGNCNVVKELLYPCGGEVNVRAIPAGDASLSVLELWGAEYQENDALLLHPDKQQLLRAICERERCPMAIIGTVNSSGRVLLVDPLAPPGSPTPEDLELESVLGKLPQKRYELARQVRHAVPLRLGQVQPLEALQRVLRMLSVGSKRFLTSKVDRSVTGLVAQQQCCGPFALPVADVAVVAQCFSGFAGAATAVGEQPLKGLLSPPAMARLALGEALTNLVWAQLSSLDDVKASGNWMYAAKLPGEGADMFDACLALREVMIALGVAVDGGKDSLSMAAKAPGETEPVRAPGQLVVSLYCGCPDVTKTVTPDLKLAGAPLLLVDLATGRRRLGGSALAHAFGQLGAEPPDMDEPLLFKRAFEVTQRLVAAGALLSGHDISDGGPLAALLEMAFASGLGLDVTLPPPSQTGADGEPVLSALFAEELGLLLEVAPSNLDAVQSAFAAASVPCILLGASVPRQTVTVRVGDELVLSTLPLGDLHQAWESTAFQLELLQASPATVAQERESVAQRIPPSWRIPFSPPSLVSPLLPVSAELPRVAVLREEGTNGDREMAAALSAAGCSPWDVTMSDLLAGRVTLEGFRGIVFAGGFSFADVLDSGKGWAGTIRHNSALRLQFDTFRERADTFSLGVCNGCQLMALLGWIPGGENVSAQQQPRFLRNLSGRFESRFVTLTVLPGSPAVLLAGMEGLTCGVWAAHGEGRLFFPEPSVRDTVDAGALAPLRYCDGRGEPTEAYPANPNGSPDGIAALCSPCGRHLAMMPHPERAFLSWQLPWVPPDCRSALPKTGASPWLRLFTNAADWCRKTKRS